VKSEAPVFRLPFFFLLSLYGVIPLVGLLILADLAFWNGRLRAVLPDHPSRWAPYNWLLVWPHIYASQFTLMDRRYLTEYRSKLSIGLPLACLAGIAAASAHKLGALAFSVVTVYHVISQQTGIASLMMGRPASGFFTAWKYLLWAGFAVALVGISVSFNRSLLAVVVGVLLAATSLCVCGQMRKLRGGVGSLYVLATQGMFLAVVAFFLLGYPVFSLLIPRLVHDTTAVSLYATHDHNRNRLQIHNFFYRLLNRLGFRIPVMWLGLAAGIGLTAATRSWNGFTSLPTVFMSIAFLHYFTEGIVWKRHAAHREFLFFDQPEQLPPPQQAPLPNPMLQRSYWLK